MKVFVAVRTFARSFVATAMTVGCSGAHASAGPPPRASSAAATARAPHAFVREQELVTLADEELENLQRIRAESTSTQEGRKVVDDRIASIERWRDNLAFDAMAYEGEGRSAVLRSDASNLERAVRMGARIVPRSTPVPAIRQNPGGLGGDEGPAPLGEGVDESYPPYR